MSEAAEHPPPKERFNEMIHEYKGSSSSDSENERPPPRGSKKKKRLFGRKEPLHKVFGGGKSADIILWRNKQVSGGILAGVTIIWILFVWIGYHLLTFICHFLIVALCVSFFWSNAASFIKRSPPKLPDAILPEEQFLRIAHIVRYEINEAFATFRLVASGKDLKSFLKVITGLWVLSVVGKWFSLLTLFYTIFFILYTAPVFYEKYEDQVEAVAEKAMAEFNKHYAVVDEKVLQKIPRGPFSSLKQH